MMELLRQKMRKRGIITVCFLLATLVCVAQKVKYKPVDYPSNYTAKLNQVYVKSNGWKGKLDLYFQPKAQQPTPLVLNIHGGGWRKGVKESQRGFKSFFKNAYAVANVAYRLSGQATAPAAIQDIRCALIYLIKNAAKYNIDTSKIVIMGGSSGGHLALMTALLGNNKHFDTNCDYLGKINVAAIVNKYGVSDLRPFKEWKSANLWLGKRVEDSTFIKLVSPIHYVNKSTPPVFSVHGTADPIVPYEQSVMLHKKLEEFGVQNELLTIENGGHGKFIYENKQLFSKKMWQFLYGLGL